MGTTPMPTTSLLARKAWATEDWFNPGQRTVFGHLFARGAVYYASKFLGMDVRGDEITYDYLGKLTGIPVGEGGTLTGNEEALDIGSYKMAIGLTRLGVKNPNTNTIEQQRALMDFVDKARPQLTRRHFELMDTACMYQLAGANPTTLTLNGTTWSGANKSFVQGHNTPVNPTSNRIVRAGGAATDQALTSSNTFSLDLIDYALEKIDSGDQPIQPFDDGTFDLYLSPFQQVDVKHDAGSKIQWYNNALANAGAGDDSQLKGKMVKTMPFLGQYSNVNIYVSPRVAYGVRSDTSAVISTVQRAVLVGKDALSFASPFGGRITDKDVPLKYFEELQDYEYFKGLEARMIYGLKKVKPSNGDDVGCMVISTYGATHS